MKTTKNTTTKTAAETYAERRSDLKDAIALLEYRLRNFDAAARKDPANWGFAGTLGHLLEEVKNMNDGLVNYAG